MRRIGPVFSMTVLLAAPLGGCGRDEIDRGLARSHEAAPQKSRGTDVETYQHRREQLLDEIQKQQEKEFAAAPAEEAEEPKPAP